MPARWKHPERPVRRPVRAAVAALAAVAFTATACTDSASSTRHPQPLPSASRYATTPNVVFVLTDDLSSDLVQYMPHVLALQRAGTSFANYTVTDSLCCPSRTSILTGQFPHNTGVVTNVLPLGGFGGFERHGNAQRTFAVALHRAGYRTALFGKYLNGYLGSTSMPGFSRSYEPQGWTSWGGGGVTGYREYDYTLNVDGRLKHWGSKPSDYLTTVVGGMARSFIGSSVAARTPFLAEIATFAPHSPSVPAPQDSGTFAGLPMPHDASFDRLPKAAPRWLAGRPALTARQVHALTVEYRRRVASVQAVDRMVGDLQATLRRTGQLDNTVFVFSSDNGYHLGQHGLTDGKLTAFDTDVRVPLIVAGPGIAAGRVDRHVVENVDLAPTFEQLAGARVPATVDGRSLVPLLHGRRVPWRTVAGVEHHGPATSPLDPDRQGRPSGNPPSYDAIRTARFTYVRYVDGSRELYDNSTDPLQTVNLAPGLSRARIAALDAMVQRLSTCVGARQCWAAGRPAAS